MDDRILIIAETDTSTVLPVTDELIALARRIDPGIIEVIVPGPAIEQAARATALRTGLPVTAVELAGPYTSELWKTILAQIIPSRHPRLIIAAHTARGQEYCPGLALKLGAECITSVQAFSRTDGTLTFTRAVLNGKMLMDVSPACATTVLTVQPGAFAASLPEPADPGVVQMLTDMTMPRQIINRGMTSPPPEDALPLVEAETIVSAGRGIGSPENLALIQELAACFRHSAVGGSRAVCDQGWLPYQRQVGLTGKTVSPKLYIACGISGSPQHVAGMKNARLIFAINTDPHAAIFQIADYGIVEDLREFIPLLIEERQKI